MGVKGAMYETEDLGSGPLDVFGSAQIQKTL